MKGPDGFEGGWTHQVYVDLKTIKLPEASGKKDKLTGVRKPLSPEEAFMASQPQSSCHAKFFSFEYLLSAQTEYEGCITSLTPRLKQ